MHIYRLLAAIFLLPALAPAQSPGSAADANVKVNAPAYHSAFESFRPMAETGETPDKKWLTTGSKAGEAEHATPLRHAYASALPEDGAQTRPAENAIPDSEGSNHAH